MDPLVNPSAQEEGTPPPELTGRNEVRETIRTDLPDGKLVRKLLARVVQFLSGSAILLFIPAGTLAYWNAWVLIGTLICLMSVSLVYFLVYDPGLLAKRMKFRENRPTQKKFVLVSGLVYLAVFSLPGFDFRFGWSRMPLWLTVIGIITLVAGYIMIVAVMRQNSYASRVIEIQEGQKVIDTGFYSVIRHPMYSAAIITYLAMPVVLGSWIGFLAMLAFPLLLPIRILNEEKMLKEELPGYAEYMKKVRYRLIPFVW